jgi:ABC-type Fe3+ transport system permease subunit
VRRDVTAWLGDAFRVTTEVELEFEKELEPETSPAEKAVRYLANGIVGLIKGIGRVILGVFKWIYGFLMGIGRFLRNPGPTLRSNYTRLRKELDWLSAAMLISIIVVFFLFLIYPLLTVVGSSFFTSTGEFTLERIFLPFTHPTFGVQFQFNIFRPSPEAGILEIWGMDLGVVFNSIYVAFIVTMISVVLGTGFAYLIAKYEFPGKSILRTALIFPMLSTPFIGAIGIRWFMGANGFLNNLVYAFFASFGLEWTRLEFHGLAAIIIVQGLSLFSLVYLNAYSSFMGIDPSLEEQAENLGASGFGLFRTVTFPLAMPGIQAGAILVFILSMEDLGTPIVYSDDLQAQKTLAYQVYNNFAAESGTINPIGPAIGMLLLVFALAGFFAIRRYASLRSYASASKGGQWNARTRHLRPRTTLLLYLVVIPVLLFALIPQISVVLLSFAEFRSAALLPPLTLDHYALLFQSEEIQGAIIRTLGYAAIATIATVLLGVSAAYVIARRDIPGNSALDLLVTSPIALPGIVIAAGYFTAYYANPILPFFPPDFPMFLIIMSFTVRKFPFTVRAAYAGLQSTPVALEEASLNVGATRNKTFKSIVLPLIGVSVLAGGLLSFVYSVSEVSTALLLGGANYGQAPLTFWIDQVYRGLPPLFGIGPAASLGVVMMVLQMVVIAITNAILKTRVSAMTGI